MRAPTRPSQRRGAGRVQLSFRPLSRPTATIEFDSISVNHLFLGGVTFSDAEADGQLCIRGDCAAATALLKGFSLRTWRS